jgi:ribose transport system ATP-binding protein
VLSASAINKRYGAVTALVDVDFDVNQGEIVALAGENGSGKSTLAKIIAGVIKRDGGTLTVDGERVEFARPKDALAHGIALVAQEVTPVPFLSVAENVLLPRSRGSFQLFRRRKAAREAAQILERVGVRCDPLATFSSLKLGDREAVEIARALATDPRILILDEATSRFGERTVERLFALLRELRAGGTSTVLITHRLREICEIADRVVVLRDGVRVGDLDASEVTETRLATMMVGRELKSFFHSTGARKGEVRLSVDGLSFPGARDPASLSVRGGEVVGLTGLVGAGRTELLEAIAGVRRPRAGVITVDGRPLRLGSPRAAIDAGIAFVPEDRHRQGLILAASVRTNVAMGSWRALSVARTSNETALASKVIDDLRVRTPGVNAPMTALSGGNQQKIVIGRCLVADPKVLLLDEPTRGIDVGAKAELFQIVAEMLARGIAIVLTSSDMLEVLALSHRILVLHEHRIVGELSREEATEERIAYLAGGGVEVAHA